MPRRKLSDVVQISPRMLAGKRNGKKGGLATASKYGQDFRTERSERGGRRVVELYGKDFYRYMRSLVKNPGPKKRKDNGQRCDVPASSTTNGTVNPATA